MTEDGKLLAKAEVVKWDGENRILAKSLIPLVDNNESWTYPSAYYIWDGEKFVRDPEFKPLEQDLKVFGVTNKDGEFAQSGKTIAELYSGNKDSLSIAEMTSTATAKATWWLPKNTAASWLFIGAATTDTRFSSLTRPSTMLVSNFWTMAYGGFIRPIRKRKERPPTSLISIMNCVIRTATFT